MFLSWILKVFELDPKGFGVFLKLVNYTADL